MMVSMNATNVPSLNSFRSLTAGSPYMDPVSDSFLNVFDWIVTVGVQMGICLLGIITNTINAATFNRIGLVDSITVSFFALSFFDFGVLFLNLLVRIWYIVGLKLGLYSDRVDSSVILFILGVITKIFYDITVFITMYIAVQKCCCVAFPLHFSNVFSRKKSIVINIGIVIGTAIYFIPMLTTQELKWTLNPMTNLTVLRRGFTEVSRSYTAVTDHGRNILLTISPLVVIFCLFAFMIKLRESAKFRKAAAMHYKNSKRSEKYSTENKLFSKKNSTSSSEIRVTKAVSFVSIIFVICTAPSVLLIYCKQFIPEFSASGFGNLYTLVYTVRINLIYLNSTLNIFVYYQYNTKFRKEIRALLTCLLFQQDDKRNGSSQ